MSPSEELPTDMYHIIGWVQVNEYSSDEEVKKVAYDAKSYFQLRKETAKGIEVRQNNVFIFKTPTDQTKYTVLAGSNINATRTLNKHNHQIRLRTKQQPEIQILLIKNVST
jgi:hypothetical protein